MDTATTRYYLLDGDSWLTAPDVLNGPWTVAAELPAVLSDLPADGNWADVKKHIPGTPPKVVPRVITSTTPAELILTTGAPDYSPLSGTRLMYVSNPTMPLFWDLVDEDYYYLASGRWFRADQLSGPWTAASANLPLEFAKIPPTSPMGYVLASIPNTQEAQDAILLASIPHKATIDIQKAKVTVTYEGEAKFDVIEGTTMSYAVNTPYEVVLAEGQYYCCYNGVWFVSPVAVGPWGVSTAVPAVVYTIPVSCPIYNVTYCQVYGYTPTTVVVGYTAGYTGEYVAATGALMFGAGMFVGAAMAHSWYGCAPCYYSYGCAAHYSYAYGGYYRGGSSCYGPHGGCGWGAAYNPATGTYSRGAYSYGPEGSHYGAQAYNPFTNTYSAHAGGSHGYQSGDRAASSAETSGPRHQWARGSVGYAQNSSGQWAGAPAATAATPWPRPPAETTTRATMATSTSRAAASGRSTTETGTGRTRPTSPRRSPRARLPGAATSLARAAPSTAGRATGTRTSGRATGRTGAAAAPTAGGSTTRSRA
jgi:hypothetical protein